MSQQYQKQKLKWIEKGKLEEREKIIDYLNNQLKEIDKNYPQENTHNFNRNTILGITKNTILLIIKQLQKEIGEEKGK